MRLPHIEWLYFLGIVAAAAAVVYCRLLPQLGSTVFADNDDSSLFIFWFAHAADVAAGWFGRGSGEANFLYTTSLNYPHGVNGGWNTTALGIALPLVPLTWACGPVVSYNVAVMASPVVCSLAAAALARQLLPRRFAFVTGAAYGFSTYVIAQSAGHLNLSSAVLPPLVALCLVRLLRGRSQPALWPVIGWGTLLGVVVGWQFYISTEMLAGAAIAFVPTLIICLLAVPRRVIAARWRLLGGGTVGTLVAVVIGLPVLLTMFLLPGAPRGPLREHGIWNTDALDPVVPGPYTLFGGGAVRIPRAMGIDPAELGGYVGIVWLVIAVLATILLWRNRALGPSIRVVALSSVLVFAIAMGSPWYIGGRVALDVTPFRIVESLPLLGNVLPMRLVVYPTLGLALLLGMAVRMLWRSGTRPAGRTRMPRPAAHIGQRRAVRTGRRPGRRGTRVRQAVAVLAVIGVFASTTPGTVPTRRPLLPEFYRGAIAQAIPRGSVVKTLPRPVASDQAGTAEAMAWQGVAGMRYRETGGYFIGGDVRNPVLYMAADDALDRFLDAHRDEHLPSPASGAARRAVAALRTAGVQYVVVAQGSPYLGYDAAKLARYLAAVARTSTRADHGVFVVKLST